MSGTTGRGASTLPLDYAFGTDRGLRRELNEDAFLAEGRLFAVADGMGGHEAGEVASRLCVETLARGQRDAAGPLGPADLRRILEEADRAIRAAAGSRAGTTLSGAALAEDGDGPCWVVFNVGDSRTYLLSGGVLLQATVDHSEVQELVDRGEIPAAAALVHPRRHVITRALGTGEDSEADLRRLPARGGDRLLVCSDGLTGEVGDERIEEVLRTCPSPQDAVDVLIQDALRSGGRDNITVVVADLHDTRTGAAPGTERAPRDRPDTAPDAAGGAGPA